MNALSNQSIIDGRDLFVTCQATFGNPSLTTIYWTKVDNPGFRQNGSTLQLPNIQKNGFDIYKCASENIYSSGEKGTHSQPWSSMFFLFLPDTIIWTTLHSLTYKRSFKVTLFYD